MRIGETLKLSVRDIDLSTDPARTDIPGNITKNGAPRLTFVIAEAAGVMYPRSYEEIHRSLGFVPASALVGPPAPGSSPLQVAAPGTKRPALSLGGINFADFM
ncbi:hypothetical protein [uncultured Methanofollis sp.]|uniref:hypothetical protein n=1 Tax=uncultured Methanofollis sp. TaxID=262500 RepID=UPI0026372E80|nr:hypothetical protein [uncultured Methanofollis sp.]